MPDRAPGPCTSCRASRSSSWPSWPRTRARRWSTSRGCAAPEPTLYLGDDVTDERAFEALDPDAGDVTVKVGDGDTAAA